MTSNSDEKLPIYKVDFQLEGHHCKDLEDSRDYTKHLLGLEGSKRKYIQPGSPCDDQVVVACIRLKDLTYEDYIKKVKKTHKGNALRNAKKADAQGYICKPFARKLFIPDICEINHSKEIRS